MIDASGHIPLTLGQLSAAVFHSLTEAIGLQTVRILLR